MDDIDLRSQWLEALRRDNNADEALLFERPPWNDAVRVLSDRARSERSQNDQNGSFVVIESSSRPPSNTNRRVEVDLLCESGVETRELVDFPEEYLRWRGAARPPDSLLIASLLHDLKNALGAQSLLLGTTERELQAAAAGSRPARVDSLLETVALCRESVGIASDRAQIAQVLSSPTSPPSLSGELWLRLAVAALGDERDQVRRAIAPEARTGPVGDCRAIVAIAVALGALAGSGSRQRAAAATLEGSVRCDSDEQLHLELVVPTRSVSREAIWAAARRTAPAQGQGRNSALVGLAEALDSRIQFRFECDATKGIVFRVTAKRSSGILR